ncbi:MAG: fluoride efflux transporter CrcB [Marinosulfonomonas sp.]|nr:fluoride efflux transporter CrcB [Marinosulfonomonas sp.]
MIISILQVAIGGAIGAVGRYLTGVAAVRLMGHGYPWGTLTVNIVGSFLMGVLIVVLMTKDGGMRIAPLLMTGMLGGFTTFSAFSLDALTIYERGQVGMAAIYVIASVVLSLLAIFLGVIVARGIWT